MPQFPKASKMLVKALVLGRWYFTVVRAHLGSTSLVLGRWYFTVVRAHLGSTSLVHRRCDRS